MKLHCLQHSFYDCWEIKLHFLQHSFYDCQEIKRTVASSNHPHVCKIFIMRKLPWQKYWPSTSSGPTAQNEKFHLLSPFHQFSRNFEATALLKLMRKTIHKPISNTPQNLVSWYGAKLLQHQQSSVVMHAGPTKAHLYITKIWMHQWDPGVGWLVHGQPTPGCKRVNISIKIPPV